MRLHNIKNGKRFVPTPFKQSIVVYYEPNISMTDHYVSRKQASGGWEPFNSLVPDSSNTDK